MSSQIQAVFIGKGKHVYKVFFRGVEIGEFESLHEASMAISKRIKGQ